MWRILKHCMTTAPAFYISQMNESKKREARLPSTLFSWRKLEPSNKKWSGKIKYATIFIFHNVCDRKGLFIL